MPGHDPIDEQAGAGPTTLVVSTVPSVRLAAWDRGGLEGLARYCARSSCNSARLESSGRALLTFARAPPQGELQWDQGAGDDFDDFDQRTEHSETPW